MNPFHDEQQKKARATLISFALTIVFSLLALYNWWELRMLVVTMMVILKVNPYAWKAIDNMMFLLAGVGWLSYVFYSQYYLKKCALAGKLLPGAALLLACQLWLLVLSRGIPALFGVINSSYGWILALEGAVAILLTAFVFSHRRIGEKGRKLTAKP
ncbi:hypothetical protein HQN89_31380 [Paenibacillus frigoriresistens]|uniref:hypothetical protein n=1 Tax=Paenibacillus alginolyticus TaxID=59839 RepID=UPI001563D644|nr:hypothetical protein [Paenibacillus frigoriresistens]NRF95379.1 hypothetical protein [Paenibacillus frigoriresistens]